MTTPAPKNLIPTEYVNNPFFVATKGINKLFLGAQGVAIMLVIASALASVGRFQNTWKPGAVSGGAATIPPLEVIVAAALAGLVGAIVVIVISTFVTGMGAYAGAVVTAGKTTSFKESFIAVREKFFAFLWLQILYGLKVLAWSLLFIVPGIVMGFRYSLANYAFFDKGLRGNAAIKESVALTKGSFLMTFASQVLFNIITFGVLNQLVSTASTAVLYRQFDATPLEERPQAHGLATATLVVFILGAIITIAGTIGFLAGLATR